MAFDPFRAIVCYGLFWIVRMNGCLRRARQPRLRGAGWFFDLRVPEDFYVTGGRTILRRYWMRIGIPFVVDIPIAAFIFLTGRFMLLPPLVLGLAALIHVNHVWSVHLAERQAQRLAVPDAGDPVARVALSLTPRRLRDYANGPLEWAMALSAAMAIMWLARVYTTSPAHLPARVVFGVPVTLLYVQLGAVLVKAIVVAWRAPAPLTQTAEHVDAREEKRKYYLRVCDAFRAAMTAAIVFWAIKISAPPASVAGLDRLWFAGYVAFGLAATVWIEIKRKQLVTLSLRARPVTLPDFLRQSELTRWPVCYQPSAPLLTLKGARGYSLNLANAFARAGVAYIAGLALLLVVLGSGR